MSTIKITANCKNLTRIEEANWEQVRTEVAVINPELAKIIDEFNPGNDYTLFKASYPYGVKIQDKGKLYLPTNNGLLTTLDDAHVSSHLHNQLNYNFSPLALILDKAIEIYVEAAEGRTIPLKLFFPGDTFGVWELMEPLATAINRGSDWSISSGARTLFLLPKISDSLCHLKLQRKYHLHSHIPNNMFDHSTIFSEIFNSQAKENTWHCQLLFFTKKWLEPHNNNIGWIKLKEYWAREAWRQLKHWTHKITFDLSWESYMTELAKQKIKLKPYLLDTVRHLIAIGCGMVPAFRPADDSQMVAPTKIIQDAYIYDYGLKSYAPVIMQPDFLQPHSPTKYVYYSLQAPTLPVKPSKPQEFTSVMKTLREIKNLMDIFIEVSKEWPEIPNTLTYDYFHTEIDPYGVIKSTPHMIRDDSSLGRCLAKYGKRLFPENSPFFRGCIRVSFEQKTTKKTIDMQNR